MRRLLVVGCVLFVGATVWIVVQATRQDSFEEAVRVDAPAGLQAFEEGDFLEAERRLSRAVAALDGLGRSDAEAEQTRQLWREAVAWANLSPLAPHELLATAREVVIDRGPDEWQAECAARYRGRWLLFAPTTVTRRGDRYVIEWSSQDGSRIYAELPEDEPDESPPAVFGPVARAPRELALAAPIADVRLEAEGTWAVVLDAGRAIRITRFEHLPVDNAERQRLAALSEVGGPDHTPSP